MSRSIDLKCIATFARVVLARRADGERLRQCALAAGDAKSAAAFKDGVARLDKLISEGGLQRFSGIITANALGPSKTPR